MAKNIEMNYLTDSGYEVLYPNITSSSLVGTLNIASQTSGKIDINLRTSGTLPISRVPGVLPLSGGTMTGNLILNGNPSSTNQAANKGYVDGLVNNVDGEIGLKVIDSKEVIVSGYRTEISSCINIGNMFNNVIGFLLKGSITLSGSNSYCDLIIQGSDYQNILTLMAMDNIGFVKFQIPFIYCDLYYQDNSVGYYQLRTLEYQTSQYLQVDDENYFATSISNITCTGTLNFYYLGI